MSQLNRTIGQQSGNAKGHLDSVAILSTDTKNIHDLFSQDLQNLTKQISVLKQKVKNNPMQLKKFLRQKLKPVQNELVFGQESQKNQNKINQQIMTEIKRQNKQTSQAIIRTFEKLKYMQSKVGRYQ